MITIELTQSSLLTSLKCPECGTLHDAATIHTVCRNCASTLFAEYDLNTGISKDVLLSRPANMWRYKEFLPIIDEQYIVTLGEGLHPYCRLKTLKCLPAATRFFGKMNLAIQQVHLRHGD